jgi:hypothetical protein
VAGVPISDALGQYGIQHDDFRTTIESEVRYANITISKVLKPANTESEWFAHGSPKSCCVTNAL